MPFCAYISCTYYDIYRGILARGRDPEITEQRECGEGEQEQIGGTTNKIRHHRSPHHSVSLSNT